MGKPETPERVEAPSRRHERRRRQPYLLRYLRPQTAVALVLWRIEAHSALPLALLMVATLGRWPGALVMGSIMAAFSAVFLFLLGDDPVLEDLRAWSERRRMGRAMSWLGERDDAVGRARRIVAVVPSIFFLGPFWRAIAYRFFGMKPALAYPLSVGASYPHSLLWTGLVLGGVWEWLILPLARDVLWPLVDGLISLLGRLA
ncbi:MAG: hypothetical protein WD379_00725 [Dehalococcoidia bacterium]